MRMLKALALITCLTAGQAALAADGLPDYYPDSMPDQGVVNEIDTASRTLTISAAEYGFDTNLQVHTLATRFGSLHYLREGTVVGFSRIARDNGRDLITEVWVLPDSTVD